MNKYQTIATLASLIAGLATTPALKADMADSTAVTKLLADAKTQSYAISVDATTLESYTRENISWQTHASEINRMKDDINATGKTVAALTSIRSQAAPWQATAIDRIIPYLRELASDTTSAIDFLNKNQSQINIRKEYKDYLEANADTSQELATLVAHFVDYGNHKNRYDSLRKTLELPAK
jgi:hypothetical protein